MPKDYAGFDMLVYTDEDQTVHSRAELYHYGRTGMKWYQHIFGDDPRWGRNGRNKAVRDAKREAKAAKRAAKLAKKTAKAQAKAEKNANKPLNANQKRRQEALERKRLQAEVNEQVNAAKEAAKKVARNVWTETDGDIEKLIKRLRDQQTLKDLVEEQTSPVKSVLKKAGKNVARKSAEALMAAAVGAGLKALGNTLSDKAKQAQQSQDGEQKTPLTETEYKNKLDDILGPLLTTAGKEIEKKKK